MNKIAEVKVAYCLAVTKIESAKCVQIPVESIFTYIITFLLRVKEQHRLEFLANFSFKIVDNATCQNSIIFHKNNHDM